LAEQPTRAAFSARLATSLLPVGVILLGLAFLIIFPINREKEYEEKQVGVGREQYEGEI